MKLFLALTPYRPKKHMAISPLATALLVCASLVTMPTLAQTSFPCQEIKATLSHAEQNFVALKGRQIKKETAADYARAHRLPPGMLDFEYRRVVYEAKKSLSGPVTACQVVDTRMDDEDEVTSQSAFECRYDRKSSASRITATMRQQLHKCVGGEVDPDSDSESLTIYLDRVESGEGWRGVLVGFETNAADGATLSLRKVVCSRKSAEGCD